MKYEYLEHTADAKFRAYGSDLEEAFSNAAIAMTNLLVNTEEIKQSKVFKIQKEAKRLESLLFDFLEELLFLLETEYFVISKIDLLHISKEGEIYKLSSDIIGDDFRSYDINGDIKSITYNDMEIKKVESGYELTVVVDI